MKPSIEILTNSVELLKEIDNDQSDATIIQVNTLISDVREAKENTDDYIRTVLDVFEELPTWVMKDSEYNQIESLLMKVRCRLV